MKLLLSFLAAFLLSFGAAAQSYYSVTGQIGFAGGGTAAYDTGAVTFDGATDWMTRGAGLTGAADGESLLVSFWAKFAADGATYTIFQGQVGASVRLHIYRFSGDNKVYFEVNNTAGTQICQLSTSAVTAASGWNNFVWSLSMGTPTAFLYRNGADDKTQLALSAGTMDFTLDDWRFGATVSGANNQLAADVADFYMALEYLDLSTNIGKFYSGGKPVNLGANGSTPTGTQPIVLFRHVTGAAASDFGTNLGSGGDFTITGTLTEAATSPSD